LDGERKVAGSGVVDCQRGSEGGLGGKTAGGSFVLIVERELKWFAELLGSFSRQLFRKFV